MKSVVYGYVRVSTKEQCEERQWIALREFPVERKNIFMDKLSGKDFNRPRYVRLIKKLRPGDVLVVKSIDRLGRSGACSSGDPGFPCRKGSMGRRKSGRTGRSPRGLRPGSWGFRRTRFCAGSAGNKCKDTLYILAQIYKE